jgi:hypothetical protein
VTSEEIRAEALRVLEDAWDPFRGYCFPNPNTYPHLWLWDSCFHAIAWGALADRRGLRELKSVFVAQLDDGFVPHMRYAEETISRGPLDYASSFTQPPVYAHAAVRLSRYGFGIDPPTLAHVAYGLEWLWTHRMNPDGLLFIVHPWESGADDSPRWDDWVGSTEWDRLEWTRADFELLEAVSYNEVGAAVTSTKFEVAPAAFNALAAHAAFELAELSGERPWADRARKLADAIDRHLWSDDEGLWSDLPGVGGGPSVHVPTLDGLLPALVTTDEQRARRAIAQLRDPDRFFAPYGLAYVARSHPSYRPDGYWRGSSWMQLNYLACLAARRWETDDVVEHLTVAVRRAVLVSGFAEHWDPETGEGHGAVPQSWSALVAAFE